MGTLSIVLIGLGGLVAVVGGIMSLVAAFRCNVWWGVATLFVPFANLVFLALHWLEARAGFLVSLAGCGIFALGFFSNPTLAAGLTELRKLNPQALQLAAKPAPEQTAAELSARIMEARERLAAEEAKFAADGEALVALFRKLTDARARLATADAAAVTAFNAQAADYQARNTARQEAKQALEALRSEIGVLAQQRERAAARAAKKVVMYSTANCGACKMAKAYLQKKGVAYEERDVNNSMEARAEFQKLGGHGVPLILVGNERLEGFSAQRLDQLL